MINFFDLSYDIINDGIFAAIACIGFASISNPTRSTFWGCALLAACGHITRFLLMDFAGWHIAMAAGVAGIVIGCLSIPLSTKIKSPAETLSFPALLPMVPGKFAYGSIQSLVELLAHKHDDPLFNQYFALFNYNWITCTLTIMAMVIGVTIPLFAFRNHGAVLLRKMRNQLLLRRSAAK